MPLPSSGTYLTLDLSLEALRITHLRGPMTRQVRHEVLRAGGEAAWQELLARVSPGCRALFSRPIGLYEWIPAEMSDELSRAYLAKGDADFIRRRSVDAAREQITVLNRWLLRLISPSFLLENVPRIFAFYYRGGRVTVDLLKEGQAELSLWAIGFYQGWYERGLTAWLEYALTLTHATGVRVIYAAPGGEGIEAYRHRYLISWNT
ncbi:MAG: hypothetical protein IPL96_15930 [Holophagaceae bacterium]|nr:hypothetical protein [Holophagaceae bacterium]